MNNKWIRGTNATVLSLAVIGIFIVATIFLGSLKGVQWDLTKNKQYTLSDQTLSFLKKLDKEIKITAFTGAQQQSDAIMNRHVLDMLREYEKRSSRITVEEIDPIKEPSKAQQYQIDSLGTTVFEMGDKQMKVYSYELFGQGSTQSTYAFSGEEKFTQTLISLISDAKHQVYFLTGHNELPAGQMSVFRSSLESAGYTIGELNLFKDGKIPDDAEAVFLIGPQNDLDEKEATALKDYVKDKGKLYISIGYAKDLTKWKHINDLLAAINVKNPNAIALETGRTSLTDQLTIIPEYSLHVIVDKLSREDRVTVLPLALVLQTDTANTDFRANALLTTTDKAYGETDLATLTTTNKTTNGDTDLKGPLDLAYAIQDKDNKPKAIVIGNTQFLMDQVIGQQGNKDFALNAVSWLQEQTDMITIRPREEAQVQQVFLMPSDRNKILYGSVVGFPLLFLVIGGVIWWRRRKG
ncbi:GldG family protein [Paenibacillus koleovorans]|uniref:GldG family protein n=1 Tax=Paenibacillus koleovorans TaxID=121608 RepID=UPI000FD9780B|nr:GldG family protein [Paenibacillus koleovorans]